MKRVFFTTDKCEILETKIFTSPEEEFYSDNPKQYKAYRVKIGYTLYPDHTEDIIKWFTEEEYNGRS